MASTYKRIMLKLSGEALGGADGHGVDRKALTYLSKIIKQVWDKKIEVAVVVGGGNFWRQRDFQDLPIERVSSDYIGMLATISNSVALHAALQEVGVEARVMSAVHVSQLSEPYLANKARRHLEKGRVVICAGGTGNPYFTTDSAAALRALELHCDILLKATTVDGVYDKDPRSNSDARKYIKVTYDEAISKKLKVMDQTAFSLCQEGELPIRVFDFSHEGNLLKAAKGDDVGTLVAER